MHSKKWHEYLLEFFMLFLAVFLGFVAENLRQKIEDSKKEKQIIVALQSDLNKDTARLNFLINVYVPTYHAWVDSSHLYVDSIPLKGHEKRIAKALFNATFWETYTPPEITLTNLKVSGTLDLIKNEKVKEGILHYNVTVNNFNKYSEFITAVEHSVDTSLTAIIPRDVMRKFLDGLGVNNSTFLKDSSLPDTIIFKTYDAMAFKRFINKLDQVDFEIHDIFGFYQNMLIEDSKLLTLVNSEYQLK
jgi:hypothetical protein